MPANTIFVGRPSKWGNPFRVQDYPNPGKQLDQNALQQLAVDDFKNALAKGRLPFTKAEIKAELRGKNLACWCREGTPCHADVLLEIANNTDGKFYDVRERGKIGDTNCPESP